MNDKRIIQITQDGSHTIAIPSKNIAYHSIHGALQESMHIFMKCGLRHCINSLPQNKPVYVFEMGLGTGLNALLAWKEATLLRQKIIYCAVELYPLTTAEANSLNYDSFMEGHNMHLSAIHNAAWNTFTVLNEYFSFEKTNIDIQAFHTTKKFHIIFFDAFDPNAQPELWTEVVFKKMFGMLHTHGILITYCSKGAVQRAMKAAGFTIEKLKGPPGKREIIRAKKTIH
ncbi:tRNA (5-methylaminomethyl-2-thiouridine)(34)-methyltransferase MnmD [Parafilimonas sp.]|uniref:tRNA (5-methylaminomethyl-2-thiouridine)(34)-methyltransferase MnmD n=1 Tax=Parafilimonas sp. TaxID=1969739 RepID=UPI0039E47C73